MSASFVERQTHTHYILSIAVGGMGGGGSSVLVKNTSCRYVRDDSIATYKLFIGLY